MGLTIKGKTTISGNASVVTSSTLVTDGLFLALDSNNKNSYPGRGISWFDICKNDNATLSGVSYVNKSMYFYGTGYVSIEDIENLNLTNFTFSTWLNCRTNDLNWNRILSKKINYTDTDGYEITLETGTSKNLLISGAGADFAVINTEIEWVLGGWHNLVVCFIDKLVKVYVDGYLKGEEGSISPIVSNHNPLLIGKILSEDTTQWIGFMDLLLFYNKVLSTDEILINYNVLKGRFGL